MEPITQRDLASHLGVSVSTVSLALRNDLRISEELRGKVHDLAAQLGYTYHLRQSQDQAVANMAFVGRYNAGNDFYSAVLSGVERVCQQNQVNLHFTQIDEKDNHFDLQNNIDALLVVGSIEPQVIQKIMKFERPLVLVDNHLSQFDVDQVVIKNSESIYRTVMRCAEWGHQRIAFLGGPGSHPSFVERQEGYQKAMDELGLPTQVMQGGSLNLGGQHRFFKSWLKENGAPTFTMLIGCSDHAAAGALRAMQDHRIRIPDDLSVIGFDDVDMSLATYPALTTHHVYRELLGEMGARMLLDRMANPGRPAMTLSVDTSFIERDSARRL